MNGLFVTGTDTEIGKTYVSSLLIKTIAEQNIKVVGMKPVASGAIKVDGVLKNEDALALINASNVNAEYENINPYVFEPAISPHIAAEQAGVEINLNKIKKHFEQLKNIADVIVVEGVGGWHAPLSSHTHTTVADLAGTLKLPVILVVGLRLGCLNHALLTAQAIRQSGLQLAGWIANHLEESFPVAEENIETLKYYLNDISCLGSIPYDLNHAKANHFDYPQEKIHFNKLTQQLNKKALINLFKS